MTRTAVIAEPNELLVRNIVRTHRVLWRSVAGFRGDDLLVVELNDGREICRWAVQPARIARLFDRRGYVDGVIEPLEEHRKAARSED